MAKKKAPAKVEEPAKRPAKKRARKPGKAPVKPVETPEPFERLTAPLAEFSSLNDNQRQFLESYVVCGTVSHACQEVGIVHQSHYGWLHNEEYKKAFELCKQRATENLIREARYRALCGMRRYKFTAKGFPIFHPVTGEPYFEDERSDGILMFLIKQGDSSFRDTSSLYVDGKLKHSGEIQHEHEVKGFTVADLSPELQGQIVDYLLAKQNATLQQPSSSTQPGGNESGTVGENHSGAVPPPVS